MALKGIMKALKRVLGDMGGDCYLIAFIDEDTEYIIIDSLSFDDFELNSTNEIIKINRDVLLENTKSTPMTISRLAVTDSQITPQELEITANIIDTTHEIFPQQVVNIEITPGQIVNFKGASLELT